ncbi:S-locus lectin protein kinase family protein, putative isoform 1 [Hibiscus syriacus]|uniref:Receptor-like serine/threonine-protein kinase n=1 Tax=Hibiscus syriacus TaxID=106335 RepID=A0A6A2ZIP3_HIBSY|nr:G-type lectin S-receptor-like serine/threonine-protein kinase At4g27290 [Hibiscus syriacus]KAE8691891.1 S-locus lectin protein kinase family protein, putative isoform 1 [Hibiscus syriacus]
MEVLMLFFLFIFILNASALKIITPGDSIKDGETLESDYGIFELGFFSPGNSNNRYIGIWYKTSNTTVVWVANREDPISDNNGVLSLDNNGTLALFNATNALLWSMNTWRTPREPVLKLLDSGNLVVKERNDDNPLNYYWESFDYPCDNFLPGMKIGKNLVTGFEYYTSAWKSSDDPSQGQYSLRMDTRGFPQLVVKKGSETVYRVGSWDGHFFSGRKPEENPVPIYSYHFVMNQNEVYFRFRSEVLNSSFISRYAMNPSGLMQRFIWREERREWQIFSTAQADICSTYNLCGSYEICGSNSFTPCSCLQGFLPKSLTFNSTNNMLDSGCVRRIALDCKGGSDVFFKLTRLKLPDTWNSWANSTMNLEQCKDLCLQNCSCTAYANLNAKERTGCLLWFNQLIDISEFSEDSQDLYIRLAKSELDEIERKKSKGKDKAVAIATPIILTMGLMLTMALLYKFKTNAGKNKERMELTIFDFATIAHATNNFSTANKLGQGGFGCVYKGLLEEGREIAVKRLSKDSGQGLDEFKNEVTLIVKLQHRNLVKLFGCCIKGDERMLIYEYLPNKSLDNFIFDKRRNKLVDWQRRFNIIDGIARGLLYLHHDSRLRIIHRDLKASNILLDHNMNPKISDFGLARMFGGDQTEDKTRRVVGTYGYMSPEYAFYGRFSMKSDVFSFGVLILEIITGKRNRGYSDPDNNLLQHAWRLWTEERSLDLIDADGGTAYTGSDPYITTEMVRCINVALLCVQQRPEDRPNMSSVLLMLGGESTLPKPNRPGYFIEKDLPPSMAADDYTSRGPSKSSNELTITILDAR